MYSLNWCKALYVCLLLTFGACKEESSQMLFVSPTGDDSNTGTESQPFASLEAARDRIRELKRSNSFPAQGIKVVLREGTYKLDQTFELGEQDAGTPSSPISYEAYFDEKVNISGGISIDPQNAKLVTDPQIKNRLPKDTQDNVYEIDLSALGIDEYGQLYQHGFSLPIKPYPMELYIMGKPQQLARWPNEGTVPVGDVLDPGSHPREGDLSNRGGIFSYDYDRADRWKKANNIWLRGIFSYGYADDNLKVDNIDWDEKTIEVAQPHMYMIRGSNEESQGQHIRGYFAYNLLEEIDMPGEYMIDSETGMLYFYPPTSLEEGRITVSTNDFPLFALENTSHITIANLTFEYARGMGLYMEKGEGNHIQNCTFRNMGLMGIMMGKGITGPDGPVHELTGAPVAREVGNMKAHAYANNAWNREAGYSHRISGCTFYQLGAGGVILDGGDRITLTRGDNTVSNCEFYDFNRWNKTYAPAIDLRGVGNKVSNNYIHDAPHTVILVSGNEHIIERNEITRVCQQADDMGAIYMGRNPSEQGNVIRHNYFHHFEDEENRITAIYFDDGQNSGRVRGNIFYKVGSPRFGAIFVHGGHDHEFVNNMFIDCMRGLGNTPWNDERWKRMMEGELWQDRLYKQVDITASPYADKYTHLFTSLKSPERTNYARNNLVVNCGVFSVPQYQLEDNWIMSSDPGFEDYTAEKFKLQEEVDISQHIPEWESIPIDSIGLNN